MQRNTHSLFRPAKKQNSNPQWHENVIAKKRVLVRKDEDKKQTKAGIHLPDKIETVDRCPLTREQATLYRAVVIESFTSWFRLVEGAIERPEHGWEQVERILRAAFRFFEEHQEFVRLAMGRAGEEK